MRLLIWVQHLLGSGHLRRALRLAAACAERGFAVTVATGGPPIPWSTRAGVEVVQLPALRATDATFATLVDENGHEADRAFWAARSERLRAIVLDTRPLAIVTELYPFGRGAFHAEVSHLLATARELVPRPRIVASVRDVLVSKPDPRAHARMLDRFEAAYDLLLVHGDPELIPFEASFPPAGRLGDRLVHTGYLTAAPAAGVAPAREEVLVSAGGGRVGGRLLEVAIEAHRLASSCDLPLRLVTGFAMPAEEAGRLAALAGPGTRIDRHHDDLVPLLQRAVVSVSQAGYNTVAETLMTGTPMVLVPFAEAGEDEQTIRARRLAGLGMAELVPEAELSPQALALAIDRACARGPMPAAPGRVDGARRSAELLAGLVAAGRAA